MKYQIVGVDDWEVTVVHRPELYRPRVNFQAVRAFRRISRPLLRHIKRAWDEADDNLLQWGASEKERAANDRLFAQLVGIEIDRAALVVGPRFNMTSLQMQASAGVMQMYEDACCLQASGELPAVIL